MSFGSIRHPKKAAFLHAYSECGNVTRAAMAAGIDRDNHYLWLRNNHGYAEAFEQAKEMAVETLEAEAHRRAMAGSDVLLIFLMKGAMPQKYRETHRLEHTGADGGPMAVKVIRGPD